MIKLNDLQFIPGSIKKRKRVARGNGGKASGRGLKGQKARSGVSLKNFQGGQTPLERRFPKHNNFYVKKKKIQAVSLESLNNVLEELGDFFNKNDNGAYIVDKILLSNLKILKKDKKLKIIGRTKFAIDIEADEFSIGAKESIEQNKGKVNIIGE